MKKVDYRGRIRRTQRMLRNAGCGCLILPPSADLLYLTGLVKAQSERLFLFGLPRTGIPFFLVPVLENELVRGLLDSALIFTWEDGQNPVFPLADILEGACGNGATVAVGDELWSRHQMEIAGSIRGSKFIPASPLLSPLRSVKEPVELQLMKTASSLTENVLRTVARRIRPGVREREFASVIIRGLLEEGLDDPWAIAASGPNSAIPHHIPGERKLRGGEPLLLDIGGSYKGYNSDITRTFHVGPPGEEFVKAYQAVLRANAIGRKSAKPSMKAYQVDDAVRNSIRESGLAEFFVHRTGHGIGLRGHEEPYISSSSNLKLKRGMAFSIEPGIYIPGKFGVRIEDIVVLTGEGSRSLTRFGRSLRII